MSRRRPEIKDWATLGRAERMLSAHRRYRHVGRCDRPAAGKVRTAVEVTVMQLVAMLPDDSPKQLLPHTSSLEYRAVIIETTRSASDGKLGKKKKKRLRNEALTALVAALDFLDD